MRLQELQPNGVPIVSFLWANAPHRYNKVRMSGLPLPIAAFFAGLISFLSPCVLPLVPGYVSLISGAGLEELKSPQAQLMRRVMINSVGFILGFSVVFITLGAISTELGQIAARYKHTLSIVAGVVIIIFGLHLTGIFKIKALYTDARLHSVKGSSTPVRLSSALRSLVAGLRAWARF